MKLKNQAKSKIPKSKRPTGTPKLKRLFRTPKKKKKTTKRKIHRDRIKILTPKQMLQRLPIALAQINAGNVLKDLLNEVRLIVYSLYQAKEITRKYKTI